MNITQKLTEIQKFVTDKQTELSEAKGELKVLVQTLKKDFGCTNPKEAKVKLKDLELQAQDLKMSLEEHLNELEEKYNAIKDN